MYQILKVLNNNGIVARCQETEEEYIFLGKGIGFSSKVDDTFESLSEAQIYILQEHLKEEDQLSVLNNVEPMFIDISNEIILLAEKTFEKMDDKILLPLADHIAFSIERIKNGIEITNPLNNDIKTLFTQEYEVAKEAVQIIERYTGVKVNEDEIGYITMHLHSALTKDHIRDSMSIVLMVEDFIHRLEENFNLNMDKESLAYSRLLTHIKYMIIRAMKKEELYVDITPYVKTQFQKSFEIAESLCHSLEEDIQCKFNETEISYLAVHIERVRTHENEQLQQKNLDMKE